MEIAWTPRSVHLLLEYRAVISVQTLYWKIKPAVLAMKHTATVEVTSVTDIVSLK